MAMPTGAGRLHPNAAKQSWAADPWSRRSAAFDKAGELRSLHGDPNEDPSEDPEWARGASLLNYGVKIYAARAIQLLSYWNNLFKYKTPVDL